MAKSQRSSRKKALRTQRAEKVTATWAAEADAKRLAALAACMDSEPIPVVSQMPEEDADNLEQQQRGRAGADSMAVDGTAAAKSSSKKGKKARKPAAAAAGGVMKKKKQSAGQKLAKEFSKKQKKARRSRI